MTDLNSADFVKAFGIALVLVGVLSLALSLLLQYGQPYLTILCIFLIALGAVFYVVLGTLKEAKAKNALIRKH